MSGHHQLREIRSGRWPWVRGAALGFALIAPVLVTPPAVAFELFGQRYFEDPVDAEPLSPDAQPYDISIDIRGVPDDVSERLKAASQLYSEREDRPPPSGAALLSRTRGEYARLLGALYGEGFYGGAVDILVDGRDPAMIAPDAVLPKPVRVTISVDPGPVFSFGEVAISGRAPPPAGADDGVDKTLADLGLQSGKVARSTAVLTGERLLIEEWRQQGYPKASIANRDATADHPSRVLDVAITASSGPAARYGVVEASGTTAMDKEFTAWMTGLEPGVTYDPDDIRRAEANLRRLEVFSSQKIVEADKVSPDGTLPLTVEVSERPLRVIGGGVTLSTLDGAGVEGYWQHRNLFGKAERLRLEGAISGINDTNVEDFSYSLGAHFLKPGVFTPFTDFTASLTAERAVYDTYTELSVTAATGLAHRFSEQLSGSVGLNVEVSRIKDSMGTRDFVFASLPAEVAYDLRNDKLEPTKGFTANLKLEPYHEFSMSNFGLITELKGTAYWSMTSDDSLVLATRGAIGSILGGDRSELPANRLFFAGGGGSVRGYGYRNLGPRISGDVVGGLSYLEVSAEVRARVSESFGVVGFVDAGNAFAEPYPDFKGGLKVGVGAGIRYYTGLGPIRLDVAVPLDGQTGDPDFGIYAGLGQAF